MEPEIIDWENIESEFVEDDEYENIDAPKWVDLSIPDEIVDDEAWFCKSACKHPKTAEDFLKSKSFKIKLLRSMTTSEFRLFRDKSRRGGLLNNHLKQTEKSTASAKQEFSKSTRLSTNELHSSHDFQTDAENQNPNHSSQLLPSCVKKTRKEATLTGNCTSEKKQINGSTENLSTSDEKPALKDTFSARNLLKGREILSQLTDFCTILKKMMAKKRTTKKDSTVIHAETKKTTTGERRRRPLEAK